MIRGSGGRHGLIRPNWPPMALAMDRPTDHFEEWTHGHSDTCQKVRDSAIGKGRAMDQFLTGKVAIVTGAGHGIGRGHALELARRGAAVVVNDVGAAVDGTGSGRDADLTVGLITSRGGTAVANYGDVGDERATAMLVHQAIDAFGRLDVVVNNAGIGRDRAIWNMTAEDFDIVMRVHVRGTWLMSHFAAIHWRERAKAGEKPYGRIINTTSGAGLQGNFGQSNYATAKAAIVGLTQTTSLELAGIGVTVNVIGPGGLTRLTATVGGQGDAFEPDELGDDDYHPMDPAGRSPLVAWLASEEAQYITGQVFRVIHDKIFHMKGWYEAATLSSGEKRWDADKLGRLVATDLFGSRAPGIRA
jgi:NAD(P)-dependent dehydrogenase (short-subunit alcohol dehydrogenase family)